MRFTCTRFLSFTGNLFLNKNYNKWGENNIKLAKRWYAEKLQKEEKIKENINLDTSKFCSGIHKEMVVRMTCLDLHDKLLKRYNNYKQLECRILNRNKNIKFFLTKWAEILVDENPSEPNVSPFEIPNALLHSASTMEIINKDIEAKWLIERIKEDKSRDCIPFPHFPSTLRMSHPQYPYSPYDLEKMQNLYGLIKWPYIPSPASSSGNSLNKKHEVSEEKNDGYLYEKYICIKSKTGCSEKYIYAPAETETGIYREE